MQLDIGDLKSYLTLAVDTILTDFIDAYESGIDMGFVLIMNDYPIFDQKIVCKSMRDNSNNFSFQIWLNPFTQKIGFNITTPNDIMFNYNQDFPEDIAKELRVALHFLKETSENTKKKMGPTNSLYSKKELAQNENEYAVQKLMETIHDGVNMAVTEDSKPDWKAILDNSVSIKQDNNKELVITFFNNYNMLVQAKNKKLEGVYKKTNETFYHITFSDKEWALLQEKAQEYQADKKKVVEEGGNNEKKSNRSRTRKNNTSAQTFHTHQK